MIMKSQWRLFLTWIALLVMTGIAVIVCVRWLDVPLALAFHVHVGTGRYAGVGEVLDSSVLIAGQLALIFSLSIVRIVRGRLPAYAKPPYIASCASLSAFVANDYMLKVIFGRQNPHDFFSNPSPHIFNFLRGDEHSGF